jgi:FMN reductase
MRNGAELVVLVGHPRAGSRTHTVARRVGELLGAALAEPGTAAPPPGLVDLAELAPCLVERHRNGTAEAALRTVGQAPVLVAASPTFRGAYSGLLKLFLDLLPRHGLAGTVVVPLMTAGIPAHRFTVDTSLRPVLQELGASVPAAGISVLETDLGRVDEVFAAWWRAEGDKLRDSLARASTSEEVRTC